MNDLARHFRIFHAQPSDDLVDKRGRAISSLSSSFKRYADAESALKLAQDLIDGFNGSALSPALSDAVTKAIRKLSPAFVLEEARLEGFACCAMAGLQALQTAKPTGSAIFVTDVLAGALLSGLEYQSPTQDPRLEELRSELRNAASNYLSSRAEQTRRRSPVPELPVPDANATIPASQLQDVIEKLRSNAQHDSEELNLLWWVVADWSTLLRRTFSYPRDSAALLAAALEVAPRLRHVPAEAHYHLVLRHAKLAEKMSLQELLSAVDSDADALRVGISSARTPVANYPTLFPLLSAMDNRSPSAIGDQTARDTETWARRALLERSLAQQVAAL